MFLQRRTGGGLIFYGPRNTNEGCSPSLCVCVCIARHARSTLGCCDQLSRSTCADRSRVQTRVTQVRTCTNALVTKWASTPDTPSPRPRLLIVKITIWVAARIAEVMVLQKISRPFEVMENVCRRVCVCAWKQRTICYLKKTKCYLNRTQSWPSSERTHKSERIRRQEPS